MRIVDRKTFLAMPAGAVFAKYRPCMFGEWSVKGDTIGANDFSCRDLVSTRTTEENLQSDYFFNLRLSEEQDIGPLDFEIERRDGCFDDLQFAVLSPDDVKALAESIRALIGTDPTTDRGEG